MLQWKQGSWSRVIRIPKPLQMCSRIFEKRTSPPPYLAQFLLRSVIISNNLRTTISSSSCYKRQFALIYTAWANWSNRSTFSVIAIGIDRSRASQHDYIDLTINGTYSESGEISVWSRSRTISFEGDRFACATCSPDRTVREGRWGWGSRKGRWPLEDSDRMDRSWDRSRSCEITGGRKRTQSVLAARKREPNWPAETGGKRKLN